MLSINATVGKPGFLGISLFLSFGIQVIYHYNRDSDMLCTLVCTYNIHLIGII